MNKNIIFHSNNLCERGVCVSIYDYAFYVRQYLNLNPIIAYDLKSDNLEESVNHFRNQFEVIGYESFQEVQKLVDKRNIDYFYAQKYGFKDEIIVKNSKNLIHSVFSRDLDQVHGDVYAFISEWMSQQVDYKIPYVSYMINLPSHQETYREGFGIPKNATVIGRYGGKETFNIDFVTKSIENILQKREDIWFLFLNTEIKINHERCLYFDPVIDLHYKVQFINTCDAFLHARDYGETFGASVLEFACKNKQIISYDNFDLQTNHPLGGRNHFLYLNQNCFSYKNQQELDDIFLNITRDNPFDTSYLNEKFSPQSVIKKFYEVFIK